MGKNKNAHIDDELANSNDVRSFAMDSSMPKATQKKNGS